MLATFEKITNNIPDRWDEVLAYLRRHSTYANPVYSPKIEAALDMKGPAVRACINHCRSQHEPIGSSSRGYWYARSADELRTTILHLEQRIRSIQPTIDGLEEAARRLEENPEPALVEPQYNEEGQGVFF